jgi:diguanylate cyclase
MTIADRAADAGLRTDANLSADVPALVHGLLGRIRVVTHELPVIVTEEILEASELLAVTALHATAVAEESRETLERAARPFDVDALTGLPNRALFRDRFSQALAHARRRNARVALLFVDLDHFKEINDVHGHAVGDMIIRYVANRLKDAGRDVDTVCRHGGDEFLILLSEIVDTTSASRFAEKVTNALSEPIRIGDSTFAIAASIGISLYPDDGDDQELLIQRADAAMYVAKRNGNGIAYASVQHQVVPSTHFPTIASGAHDPIGLLEVALAESQTIIADLKATNVRLELDILNAEREQVKANEAKQYQSRLLNVVAHELRSSLSPLQSAADVLTLVRMDPSLMGRLELVLKRQIGHIFTLLTDLLDVSRLNMGRLTIDVERVDMGDVVEHAASQVANGLAKREHDVLVTIETDSRHVLGDKARLTQVVATLLDRVSANLKQGAEITASLYDHDGTLILAIAEGRDTTVAHDAHAQALDLNDDLSSATASDVMTVAVMVVIELLKSHGGQLTVSRADNGEISRMQIALPRAE